MDMEKQPKALDTDQDDILGSQGGGPIQGHENQGDRADRGDYTAGQEGLARGTPDEEPGRYTTGSTPQKWEGDSVEGTDRET